MATKAETTNIEPITAAKVSSEAGLKEKAREALEVLRRAAPKPVAMPKTIGRQLDRVGLAERDYSGGVEMTHDVGVYVLTES